MLHPIILGQFRLAPFPDPVHPSFVTGTEDGDTVTVPGPWLTVATVAHRLGIAPSTLRTWDRRYGVGPSQHSAGSHRRYTTGDLARLEVMRRLTLEGVAPREAARFALAGPAATGALPLSAPAPDRTGRVRGGRGGPGGRVLPLPGAEAAARGLGRAAMALDSAAMIRAVTGQLVAHGVLHTWEHLLTPVLVAAGERWAATGEGVEVEHLLADCIAVALRQHGPTAREPAGGRPVLLACAPGDQHVLPLHALAAGLAERGTAARVLGAAMPIEALQAAVRRTGPAVLFLWSQLRATADVTALTTLPITRPPTALLVGGPGWDVGHLPERVGAAGDLAEAIDLIGQALGA